MNDLATWLLEQIDEDERVARAADPGSWEVNQMPPRPDLYRVVASTVNRVPCESFDAHNPVHIARWNPARVLAECDAKRRVLDEHRRRDEVHLIDDSAPPRFADPSCAGCGFDGDEEPRTAHVDECPTLRAVALAYVDRSGYREEWKS